jgi:hypothetical protein
VSKKIFLPRLRDSKTFRFKADRPPNELARVAAMASSCPIDAWRQLSALHGVGRGGASNTASRVPCNAMIVEIPSSLRLGCNKMTHFKGEGYEGANAGCIRMFDPNSRRQRLCRPAECSVRTNTRSRKEGTAADCRIQPCHRLLAGKLDTFRLPGVVGDVFGEKLTFFIDDQRIKELDIGETFTVRLPLGVHYMRYERRMMGSFNKGGVPIMLKSPHHYFRVYHVQKINDWEEVSEDVGRSAVEKLSQVK